MAAKPAMRPNQRHCRERFKDVPRAKLPEIPGTQGARHGTKIDRRPRPIRMPDPRVGLA